MDELSVLRAQLVAEREQRAAAEAQRAAAAVAEAQRAAEAEAQARADSAGMALEKHRDRIRRY